MKNCDQNILCGKNIFNFKNISSKNVLRILFLKQLKEKYAYMPKCICCTLFCVLVCYRLHLFPLKKCRSYHNRGPKHVCQIYQKCFKEKQCDLFAKRKIKDKSTKVWPEIRGPFMSFPKHSGSGSAFLHISLILNFVHFMRMQYNNQACTYAYIQYTQQINIQCVYILVYIIQNKT